MNPRRVPRKHFDVSSSSYGGWGVVVSRPLDLPAPRGLRRRDGPVADRRQRDVDDDLSAAGPDLGGEPVEVRLLVVARDGRVVFANEAARALRIERLEPLQWAVTRALLTEDAVREDEIEIVAPGQPRRWLSACVSPLRVPGVGVTAAFVTLVDATARKRLREWDPVIQTLVNL